MTKSSAHIHSTVPDPHVLIMAHVMFVLKEKEKKGPSSEEKKHKNFTYIAFISAKTETRGALGHAGSAYSGCGTHNVCTTRKEKKGRQAKGKKHKGKNGLLTEPHASHLGRLFISLKTEAIRSRCSWPCVILTIISVSSVESRVTAWPRSSNCKVRRVHRISWSRNGKWRVKEGLEESSGLTFTVWFAMTEKTNLTSVEKR